MRNRTFFLLDAASGISGIASSIAMCIAVSACAHAPPNVDGVASVPRGPGVLWDPPPSAVTAPPPTPPSLPADIADRAQHLTLADVTDIALRNNPATRESWETARAAAYEVGAARTRLIPTIDGSVTGSRSRTTAQSSSASATAARERTQYIPELSLQFLLFDFGGRSGTIEAARQALFSAGLLHNAMVQSTVLQVQSAFFTYMANKGLLAARQAELTSAQTSLQAAQQRHNVGLATIADVLQAQTAVSQAELDLETTQGDLQAARGALAAGMGFPANLPYDINAQASDIPVRDIAVSVDSLIDAAVRARPDFLAAQADAREAAARISVARSAGLPSVTLGGTAGHTYSTPSTLSGPTYGLSIGVQIPLMTALTNGYNVQTARALAAAQRARADVVRQQVIQQVFTSYYALQTATQRVSTTDALLTAALQSEQVAAGRYREGVGSILDLLTAQSALANARAQQVQARWQWSTALAQLAHDAGILGVHGETPVGLSAAPIPPAPTPAVPMPTPVSPVPATIPPTSAPSASTPSPSPSGAPVRPDTATSR